jgi:glycosyltransferase 2 family protein
VSGAPLPLAGPPNGAKPPRRRRSRWADPRLWISVVITAVTLWLALRGVSFRDVARDMARADLPFVLGVSVPAYVAMVWLRALRWRHLTDAVCPIASGPLFRATAVGFLANNVFPLRIGELVRAWYLARETRARAAALFGTVMLERVIDGVVVLAMALFVFGARTGSRSSALAVGIPLIFGIVVPVGGVVLLRIAPDATIGLLTRVVRVVASQRIADATEGPVRRMAEGLDSLRGGRHVFWVAFHSVMIWLVLGVVPFVATIEGLGIDLGSTERLWQASYVVLTAVGIAVALPSAPGFFGPYHLAAREALSRFGVSDEQALAVGTLAHAVFWLSTTLLGLAVLRFRATRLDELAHVAADASKGPAVDRR